MTAGISTRGANRSPADPLSNLMHRWLPYALRPPALLLLLTLGTSVSAAAADPAAPPPSAKAPSAAQKETARSWLIEGQELFDSKRYGPALERFSAAYSLVRVPTAGMAVARAQAALGQWVEANATAFEVMNLPSQPDEPEVFRQARVDAEAMWERLSRLVPSVQVEVTPAQAQVRIEIDGEAMPNTIARMPFKLNPGEHRLVVSAPGHVPVERTFRLAEKQQQRLSIALVPAPGGEPAVAATLDESAPPQALPPESSTEDTGSGARTRGYIALGVGGVAALTGSVTGMLAFTTKPDCPNDVCTSSRQKDIDASKLYGNIATVSFGVAAIAGVYALWELLANAPSEHASASARLIALPAVVPTVSGARLEWSAAF